MKIHDLAEPRVGDIVEFETSAGDLVEGVIVDLAEDGYVYEFSESGLAALEEACQYGRYYCSTDKKWKCRQGPRQTREVSEDAAGYIPKNSREAQDPRWSAALTQDVSTHTMRDQLRAFFPTSAPPGRQTQVTEHQVGEAKYKGREVKLGKPIRGGNKKSYVYVRNPETGNVIKVSFGDPNMRIKKSNPARRRSFRARHRCSTAKDRTSARYWSCRAW